MAGGKVIFYEVLEDSDDWGLVQYNLDRTQKQVLVANASGAALSTDGSRMAYPAEGGIRILDLATRTESVLPVSGAFDLHWSPDGSHIAYIGLSDTIINSAFIVDVSTGETHQVSEWSYELIAGWSPDGNQLYYVVPFTGGAAWKMYRHSLSDSQTQELFTIENGTAKALSPRISPDGEWIAYRGRDNSSIYLVRPDGSDLHLIMDNVGASGLVWSASGWLGTSLHNNSFDESLLILINPETCDRFLLPGFDGVVNGLFISN